MDLLILGASARAAACSALRAGFRPTCLDLFADRDLTSACPGQSIRPADYPEGLADLAEQIEPIGWLYTGGIENHPDLVDRVSTRHALLGNPGTVLRAVRDPAALALALSANGVKTPRILLDPDDVPSDGSWLIKPKASAGGRGIRVFRGNRAVPVDRHYFQERVEGLSLSALFLADADRTSCLGVTRQFVGKPGNRFAYRGTLAPWTVADEVMERIERIGQTVSSCFGVRGIFGVDLILKDNDPWPIEVNPRYTASVEALEWATGRSFLGEHARAFGFEPPVFGGNLRAEGFVGKAIVHATRAFSWTERVDDDFKPALMPEIADIPAEGTVFAPGDPVMTVLARGDSPRECRKSLGARILDWRRRLSIVPG